MQFRNITSTQKNKFKIVFLEKQQNHEKHDFTHYHSIVFFH